MRLVEIDGYYVNPDRVAYVKDATSHHGGKTQTRIYFSGASGDDLRVDDEAAEVARKLTVVMPRPPQ